MQVEKSSSLQGEESGDSVLQPQGKGMFGKLFSRIGGMFGGSSAFSNVSEKQTINLDTTEANSYQSAAQTITASGPSSTEQNQEGAALQQTEPEPAILVDSNVDVSLLERPMRRYGRICDCPKDANYSMFCQRARNWYESTSTGSQSL